MGVYCMVCMVLVGGDETKFLEVYIWGGAAVVSCDGEPSIYIKYLDEYKCIF